jgi:hypothetical protein
VSLHHLFHSLSLFCPHFLLLLFALPSFCLPLFNFSFFFCLRLLDGNHLHFGSKHVSLIPQTQTYSFSPFHIFHSGPWKIRDFSLVLHLRFCHLSSYSYPSSFCLVSFGNLFPTSMRHIFSHFWRIVPYHLSYSLLRLSFCFPSFHFLSFFISVYLTPTIKHDLLMFHKLTFTFPIFTLAHFPFKTLDD